MGLKTMTKTKRVGRKGRATWIDQHVGARVKARRLEMGMSQADLSNIIGITFQQLQKNERGANRFGASRLYETAQALAVPVSYFYDGVEDARTGPGMPIDATRTPQIEGPEQKRETIELVRAYYDIPDRKVRQQIVGTMRALARTDGDSPIHDRPRRGRPRRDAE